jgi:membrane protease subunit (stomatin/prohibitin family)
MQRGEFLEHSGRIRDLAKPGELSRRITRDVQVQGRKALSQAMEIAADERGVLAGTLTALMLWMACKQVFAKAVELAPRQTRMGQDADLVKGGLEKAKTACAARADRYKTCAKCNQNMLDFNLCGAC